MKNEDSNLNDPVQSMALFAELNPEPVIRFDKSGKILQSNPAANELFEKEEMVETWITEVLPECRKADLEKIIEGNKIETFTVKLQGKYYNFLFRGISKFNVCQIYGFDINDKIKAQKEAESMALFAQKNPAPVFRFDFSGEVKQSNESADELFKVICKDNVNIFNLFTDLNEDQVRNMIENNEIESFVKRIKDSHYRFELRGISELDSVQVYGADITEIVNAQFENEKLSTAVQQSSNTVMITDTSGNIEFVNKAFEKITGYSRHEVIGYNPRFLQTGYHNKEFYNELWNTINNGEVWKGEFYNRRKDGAEYWEEASISPIFDRNDRIRNFIAVKEDVTEKKKAQEQIQSMALFAKLNPEPVIRFDKNGEILQANPAANESFSMKSIEGMQIKDLISELKDINIPDFIENNQIETVDITNHDKTYRFILKGIQEIGVCQIYGSDITKRIQAQKNAESMALFAKLNPEPVFRFDKEGMVLQSNPAANELFEKDTLIGYNVNELISELSELDFASFISNDKILTFTEQVYDSILRFKLRGISDIGICQIYGSDITNRVKAEQKVRQQKKDIDDSIHYASRIQTAVLPSADVLDDYVQDHFILFKPRDVVSGDFYWMKEKDNKLVFVAADCTGHGVPGAFMSMLGVSFLNEIVNKDKVTSASNILDELRYLVKSTLSHSKEQKADGMDISLVIIDRQNMKMQFAGAYNHLYLFRDKELQVTKADRMPIGNYVGKERPFTNHEMDLKKGDTFYLLSDGFPDQFDEHSKKKFSIKRLKEVFSAIHTKSMDQQEKYLDDTFYKWKGNHWQMDDVLITGIRI
jgi:PAS domain S-box-containing protein